MNNRTLAAIDIGSNAIRLLINSVEQYGAERQFKKIAFLRIPLRLGGDVFTMGYIGEHKSQQLLDSICGFAHIMRAFGVLDYRACATSAMREAENGGAIVEMIYQQCGVKIDVISGEEEANIIYEAGGLDYARSRKRHCLYIDVGGGSTEIIVYNGVKKVAAYSFRLGTVRMLSEAIEVREWEFFKAWLEDVYVKYEPQFIIGSGGNINKVHRLLGKQERESVGSAEIKRLYCQLKSMSYEERMQKMRLNSSRADVIVPALKIFLTATKLCKIDEVVVPKVGLADGIIHQLYAKNF